MSVPGTDRSSPLRDSETSQLLESPEMRELLRLRRRFFSRAWAVFAGSLALLFGWAALFRDTFGTMIGGSLSLGLLIGLAYVAVVFALTVGYARRAREWDGLIARMLDSHRPAPSRSEA